MFTENGPIVLVLEDCPAIGDLLRLSLTHYGFRPKVVDSVERALWAITQWKPDFILSDYSLPDGTGDDFLDGVLETHPDIVSGKRFQFVTGEPDAVSQRARDLELPIHGKPFLVADIVKEMLRCADLDSHPPQAMNSMAPAQPPRIGATTGIQA